MAVALKWPNDLYVGRRKLAGVLAESRTQGDETGRGRRRRDQRPRPIRRARRFRTRRRSRRRPAAAFRWPRSSRRSSSGSTASSPRPRWDEEIRAWELVSLHRPGDVLTIRRADEEVTRRVPRARPGGLPQAARRRPARRSSPRARSRSGEAARRFSPSTSATRTPSSGSGAGTELARSWRLTTRRDATADEIALSIRGLFAAGPAPEELAPMRVIVASVVPSLRFSLRQALRQILEREPAVRRARESRRACRSSTTCRRKSAPTASSTPSRRCDRLGGPCIVVDFGTATTFDVVTREGRVRRRRHRSRDRDLGRGPLREGRAALARRDPAARPRRRKDDGGVDPVRPLLRLPLARGRHDRPHRLARSEGSPG